MTPAAAINHVLDSVDGIEIDADNDETVATLMACATAIAGVALMRLEPHEREPLLFGIEPGIRDYIRQVLARRTMRPAANGHATSDGL